MVVLDEIEQIRANLLKYTQKAFLKLPKVDKPRILDIGCGSGLPTLELARLSGGEVVGIDVDSSCIDAFNKKIVQKKLSSRVKAICVSVVESGLPSESFDVVWSEGVISTFDFESELKNWRSLLKPNGYLVIHYQISSAKDSIPKIPQIGYRLVETVLLPPDAWWTDFYKPLEKQMGTLRRKYANNSAALKLLEQLEEEMGKVKVNPAAFNSAFYILKKSLKGQSIS
ncbi:MAG: class I SAM-dependent methyltransferase [Candidatus Bathyarchaeota archaeon]|nr:class I SAM-dependent methyltransferase [Candidatus Bathyarchaeota archaeon]